jgi:hypothetical protein
MARRRGQLGHAAHPLRRPKRELCVVNGWRRLRKRGAQRCATAAGEAQPGLDKDERGIELVALRGVPAQAAAEQCGMSVDEVYVAKNRVTRQLREIVTEMTKAYDDE